MKKLSNAYFRFALSATPWRYDGADLAIEAQCGRKICSIKASTLISLGFLTKPIIWFIRFNHNKQPKNLTYGELYKKQIVENDERNKLITKIVLSYINNKHRRGEQAKVLVAVTYIRHGQLLLEQLSCLGDKVKFVNGQLPGPEMFQSLKDLEQGKLECIIATTVFGEGINVPSLGLLVNCKSQDSPVDALQLVGRVLRKTANKDYVLVIDFFDEGCRYFKKHSQTRYNIYTSELFNPQIVQNINYEQLH
jgi:superfamily II DNA or RNA helicase